MSTRVHIRYLDFDRCAIDLSLDELVNEVMGCIVLLDCLSNGPELRAAYPKDAPEVNAWDGYHEALIEYALVICGRLIEVAPQRAKRNGSPVCKAWGLSIRRRLLDYSWGGDTVLPPWLTEAYCRRLRRGFAGPL